MRTEKYQNSGNQKYHTSTTKSVCEMSMEKNEVILSIFYIESIACEEGELNEI